MLITDKQIARSRRALPLCFGLLLAFVAGCAVVPEYPSKLDRVLAQGSLRVGTTGDFMPFSYREDESPTPRGVDIDLARSLALDLGVELTLVRTTWPTLISDLLADRFDIAMSGITVTPERQKVAFFSRPTMSSGKVAITRAENVERFRTIENINRAGVRVIVNPGGTNETFARENFPQATIIVNEENLTVFDKIIAGVADVMVTDAVEAAVQELIHPELEVTNSNEPFNTFSFAYLMSRDQPLKDRVDRWLEQQHRDGTYQLQFEAELIHIRQHANSASAEAVRP